MPHDVLLQHGFEAAVNSGLLNHPVSFLDGSSLSYAGHWLKDHLPWASHAEQVDGPRFVEYYAKDCPHCVHLAPVWKEAAHEWVREHPDTTVHWQQKECFGSGWGKGSDYDECQKLGVESFPTVKFYKGLQDAAGEEYSGERSVASMVDFISSHTKPTTAAAVAASNSEDSSAVAAAVSSDGHMSGGRFVEYYAKDCPHCQDLDPVWKDAKLQWATSHPGKDAGGVSWEQKECYGAGWKPGEDAKECQAEGIQSFPTVRFHAKDGHNFQDFNDDRTAAKLTDFANEQSKEPEMVAAATPQDEAAPAAVATVDSHSASAALKGAGPIRVVEYVSKSCPHCVHLEPAWKTAQVQWAAAHGSSAQQVAWEQKECYGQGWSDGRDLADCQKAGIEGFPTIKLYNGSSPSSVHTFEGSRTASGILGFVKDHVAPAAPARMEAAKAEDDAVAPSDMEVRRSPQEMILAKNNFAAFGKSAHDVAQAGAGPALAASMLFGPTQALPRKCIATTRRSKHDMGLFL
eukprot:TRINITY_DN17707_c0_g1_i1.p1 TRINITY_DN17707_c0_g1~~TRINITY_DN17707_c0_g1_i1.p1  ORF type:complete len:516 (-),score=123.20 TRINITY_DN17707_c0_g1_i1:618-2165(-)